MKPTMLEIARQVDQFFMDKSPIHDTMRRLSTTLRAMDISFAIAGAMAANVHGHRRTTSDVDVLIRPEDLTSLQRSLAGSWLG